MHKGYRTYELINPLTSLSVPRPPEAQGWWQTAVSDRLLDEYNVHRPPEAHGFSHPGRPAAHSVALPVPPPPEAQGVSHLDVAHSKHQRELCIVPLMHKGYRTEAAAAGQSDEEGASSP